MSLKLPLRRHAIARVRTSNNGMGLYAARAVTKGSVIGKVAGKIVDNDKRDPNYLMELENDLLLNPGRPFRYLNHSCLPNCELFMWDDVEPDPQTGTRELYVSAQRSISPGDELTIDYSWPACIAIPCHCDSSECRGWIVDPDELYLLEDSLGQ